MQVRDGMSTDVLSVGPDHTLRAASRAMATRKVGAAVVHDPDGEGVGILTERDVLARSAQARTPTSSGSATM
jgi:CBS domain-containing protein